MRLLKATTIYCTSTYWSRHCYYPPQSVANRKFLLDGMLHLHTTYIIVLISDKLFLNQASNQHHLIQHIFPISWILPLLIFCFAIAAASLIFEIRKLFHIFNAAIYFFFNIYFFIVWSSSYLPILCNDSPSTPNQTYFFQNLLILIDSITWKRYN